MGSGERSIAQARNFRAFCVQLTRASAMINEICPAHVMLMVRRYRRRICTLSMDRVLKPQTRRSVEGSLSSWRCPNSLRSPKSRLDPLILPRLHPQNLISDLCSPTSGPHLPIIPASVHRVVNSQPSTLMSLPLASRVSHSWFLLASISAWTVKVRTSPLA